MLEALGLRLTFEMAATSPAQDLRVAPLPAQFHFRGPRGLEVIYLAGKDVSYEQYHPLPPHASRWWAYPGANPLLCAQVTKALSARWQLHWRTSAPDTPSQALAQSA